MVGNIRKRRHDPLGVHTRLELHASYHPFGFRLDVETNSQDVIEAAEESWGGQKAAFDAPSLTMRVVVQPDGALAHPGSHRKIGHQFSVVSDRDNFAHIDLREQTAFIQVSQMTASDHCWLRWFFVESMTYVMLSQRHIVMVHAAFVARDGRGVLLSGASGAGKSTLSYAAARAGWTFLADDSTILLLHADDCVALGRPWQVRFRPDAVSLFPEVAGFAARARPTGKLAIEASPAALGLTTAERATVETVAFLERRAGALSAERISGEEAVERLIADLPSYGPEVDDAHERAVSRLADGRAYVLRYESIDQGLQLLTGL